MKVKKIIWQGNLISIQPRIRLMRSFDEVSHSYLGYNLEIEGIVSNLKKVFTVAVGKAVQQKLQLQAGMKISGASLPVENARMEVAEYYKTSKLNILSTNLPEKNPSPPFNFAPPELQVYRERGHRRLDPKTFNAKCHTCSWGCKMPVEIIIDHWNPGKKKYRFETFCYGPKSCKLYRAGSTRKVLGRKGMSFEEEDWIDEDRTFHRSEDE